MSELPYIVAQTATIFAPADADPQTFTLDFSLQTIMNLTTPMSGPGWGGGALGAVIILEGGPDIEVNTETGVHVISPWTSGAQAENGLTIVKLEEGGAPLKRGAVTPQAQQGAVVRGRRGTTGRNAGAAGFSGNPSPGGGGGGIV